MKKIGEGMSAIVYSDGEYAYKKYRENYNLDNMKFEKEVQNEIYHNTNLDVAKYEIVDDVIKMTLLEGNNLSERIMNENDTSGMIDFIRLQLDIFQYKNLNLADSYKTFSTQIKGTCAPRILKEKALKSIEKIEKIHHLCHFDYHPKNIVYHHDVPYIIDWTNAKLGNPVMDIASTYIIFLLFAKDYAKLYLDTMIENGYDINEIKDAIPVMAFIRYRETIDEKLKSKLEELINGNNQIR